MTTMPAKPKGWDRRKWEKEYLKAPMPLGPHALLMTLAALADADGVCEMTTGELAEATGGCTDRAIYNWLKALREEGWIFRGANTGRGNVGQIRLLFKQA